MFHKMFREQSHPSVVTVEDDPFPRCAGLPDPIVFQQGWRIEVHDDINEAGDAAGRQRLQISRHPQQKVSI